MTPEQEAQYPSLGAKLKNFEGCARENEYIRKEVLAIATTKADAEPTGDVYLDALRIVLQASGYLGNVYRFHYLNTAK